MSMGVRCDVWWRMGRLGVSFPRKPLSMLLYETINGRTIPSVVYDVYDLWKSHLKWIRELASDVRSSTSAYLYKNIRI